METIDVFVSSGDQVTQIFKPYGDTYERAQGIAQLESVKFQPGDENRYWGWIGYLSGSGAVTQARTRGLRVRVRNIQVDGTEILESLFASVKPSYGRFSAYYVGEIHIDPERVIPNARRDGFEETAEWISIKKSLIWNVCDPLAKGAYLASQAEQTDVKKLVEHIKKLVESSQDLANNSRASYDQVVDMMNSAKRLRRRATAALKVVADLDEAAIETATNKAETTGTQLEQAAKDVESVESQARMLIGRFLDEDERLSALKQRLREEIIVELLDILNAFVDPTTYQKIKRQLMKGDRQ